jgi:hypothetical protein
MVTGQCGPFPDALAFYPEKHPADQAEQRHKEQQQEAAEGQRHRPLLFRPRLGNTKGSDKALNQEIQQFHSTVRLLSIACRLC